MATLLEESPFFNGYWSWDNVKNCLQFNTRVQKATVDQVMGSAVTAGAAKNAFTIRFKETMDNLAQAYFRRMFQRRIKPKEPNVVTIQDIKDVVIFTANPKDLMPEFISYMHTEGMDVFLRSLIVYFQYYVEVWDAMVKRREEAKRKLRQPLVTAVENVMRDNLSDLRSMVSRNYGALLLGIGDTKKFYHMKSGNKVSLSDRDRLLFECLMCMAPRIIWIALQRKYLSLIDFELNRMFRTKIFSDRTHKTITKTGPVEDRVLLGAAYRSEKKLKHRSPIVQEVIYDDHNYKMLAIGCLRIEPFDDRLKYLETAFTAPEELLTELNMGIGILGLPRGDFEPILVPKETVTKKIQISQFKLPINEPLTEVIGKSLPKENLGRYRETEQTKQDRMTQHDMWQKYLQNFM